MSFTEKEFAELRESAKKDLGVDVKESMRTSVDKKILGDAVETIRWFFKEFPGLRGVLRTLDDDENRGDAYASSDGHEISLNPAYTRDAQSFEASYASDVSTKWHPAGTKSDSIIAHEIGHVLEKAMIIKNLGEADAEGFLGQRQWKSHVIAEKVVNDALFEAKKTPGSQGKTFTQLIRGISRYSADKNAGETMAEAVADYYSNRENAAPLSKAIWEEIKRRLQ